MRALRNRLEDLRLAMMMLTRLPMGHAPLSPDANLARALWAYPLAGALLGAISGGVFALAEFAGLSGSIAAVLALVAGVLASGALHEDGLADFCDGIGGGRDPAARLAIMRDSQIGTYGAVGLILCLLLRWSAVTGLGDARQVALVWIAAGALSRGVIAIPLCLLGPARRDGLGAAAASPPLWSALSAGSLAALVAVLLLHRHALLLIGAALVAALLITALAGKYLRGHTGDVLGATALVAETVVLVVAGTAWF